MAALRRKVCSTCFNLGNQLSQSLAALVAAGHLAVLAQHARRLRFRGLLLRRRLKRRNDRRIAQKLQQQRRVPHAPGKPLAHVNTEPVRLQKRKEEEEKKKRKERHKKRSTQLLAFLNHVERTS
jgi:hypothetical protein